MNETTTPILFEGAKDKQLFAEIIIEVIKSKHRRFDREHKESGYERVPLANIHFEIVHALNGDFYGIGDFESNTGGPRLQTIAKIQGKPNENLLITAQRMLDLFCAIGEIEQYEGIYKLSKGGVLHKYLTPKLASTIRDLPTDKMPHNIKIHTNTNKEIELYKASYALVIGNSNYTEWEPLPGARQDVNEVKEVLVKHGFNVNLKIDLNKTEFEKAVAQFVLKSGKDKDNRLLFYYAGHGYTRNVNDEDLGYLVMVDAPTPDTDEIGFEVASIDMSSLVTHAEKIQARHVLFMFDSCFSGTIFNVRNELQLPRGILDSVKHPVRQFITAGKAGETVPDRSYFKVAFLDLIQGHVPEPFHDGYITGEELGYYLKNKVPEYIEGQHPQYGKIRNPNLDKGDFVFVLPVGKDEADTEDFVKLDMPLEEALTKITFIVTWLSGEGSDEVIFKGEGVIRTSDYIELRIPYEDDSSRYSSYTILPKYAIEGNRYIFVPLAQSGGGSGVFWALNIVDKKTLRSVDDVGLGDRADVKEVILADADSDTVSVTYVKREVRDRKVVYDPEKAIKKHFRMIQGTLQEVEIPNRVTSAPYADMILIPAGEFEMVSSISDSGEKLIYTVYIDAFYMDKYQVTNAQYKVFLDANPDWQKGNISSKYHDGNYLKSWNGNNYPSDKDNHPVVNVSWYGAMAYAKWVGKRLPTQAEWEKAARGGLVGQKYPWGNSIDSSKANYGRNVGDTTSVGSYPPNGYNLYDMTGNVWEWCLDEYERYLTPPRHNPIAGAGSITGTVNEFLNLDLWRVLCGGSWIRFARDVAVSDGNHAPPNFSNEDFGFRCVRSVEH
ncbi:MAG: SUMF1/EgtB/PvdO family nonheme iron enzyme [Candidatus Poribacteria bacterium]|nr:SUMF1/EgtB/PvdO family nonheme iron enzyme [Candidatus Poribacteria bacterium]